MRALCARVGASNVNRSYLQKYETVQAPDLSQGNTQLSPPWITLELSWCSLGSLGISWICLVAPLGSLGVLLRLIGHVWASLHRLIFSY